MRFRSLQELINSKQHCPLCDKNLFLGFNIVNDKAYIKYKRQEEDVFMIVNTVSNDVTYTAFKRPIYKNKLVDFCREENVFLANCKFREVQVHRDRVTAANYEYGMSFALNLAPKYNQVAEVELLNEKFFLIDNGLVQEVVINHKVGEITISTIEDKSHEHIVTTPLSYITIDENFNREYLLKKIRTVSLFT